MLKIVLTMALCIALVGSAVPLKMEWERVFTVGPKNFCDSVRQTEDGGYIILGSIKNSGDEDVFGDRDVLIIKTDSEGKEEWSKTFGGESPDFPSAIEQTSDGGYIFIGTTRSFAPFVQIRAGENEIKTNNLWLVKLDSKGRVEWMKTFNKGNATAGSSVQQTGDGGYVMVGYVFFKFPYNKTWLIKTDAKGNIEWEKTFEIRKESYEAGLSVRQAKDGGYTIVGGSYSHSESQLLLYALKTDAKGNIQWKKTFNEGYDSFREVHQTENGYLSIAYDKADNEYILKTDTEGKLEWSYDLEKGKEEIASVEQLSDGNYIAVGTLFSPEHKDLLLLKLDAEGNEEWNMTQRSADNGTGSAIQQTKDGGYIVGGIYGGSGIWLIKLSPALVPEAPEKPAIILDIRDAGAKLDEKTKDEIVVVTLIYGEKMDLSDLAFSVSGDDSVWRAVGHFPSAGTWETGTSVTLVEKFPNHVVPGKLYVKIVRKSTGDLAERW